MVVHHSNLKPCVLPAGKEVTFCPSPELIDIIALQGEAIPPQAQGIGPAGGPNHRPARLIQTIDPLKVWRFCCPLIKGGGEMLCIVVILIVL